MWNTILKIMMLALLVTVSRYGTAAPVPEQGTIKMDAMTVAELEKAGDQARSVKDYSLAVDYFKAGLRKDPKNAVLYNKMGLAELRKDNLAAARVNFARAVKQTSYLLAKAYAKRGDIEGCLQCLKRAKEDGYRNLANVYKDEEFSRMRDNPRLQEVVPPPTAK